jgi:tripartite-type tricarboxylate transporter receptor subunit TctC
MVDALDKVGNEPTFATPAKFTEIVKADIERWGPVVKQSGFVADE